MKLERNLKRKKENMLTVCFKSVVFDYLRKKVLLLPKYTYLLYLSVYLNLYLNFTYTHTRYIDEGIQFRNIFVWNLEPTVVVLVVEPTVVVDIVVVVVVVVDVVQML